MIETITIASLICLSVIVCVVIVAKAVKSVFVSRSNLAVFRRQANKRHAEQIQEFEKLMTVNKQEIADLKSKIDALSMSVGLMS